MAMTRRRSRRELLVGVAGAGATTLLATRAGVAAAASSPCPVPTAAELLVQLSSTSVRVGDAVLAKAALPTMDEDGTAAPPVSDVSVWWNLESTAWWTALTGSPSPAVEGEAVSEVARASVATGSCSFAVEFVVPNVPAGIYPVVVLFADATGDAAPYLPVVVEVTQQ
jgi:hypothetical protein